MTQPIDFVIITALQEELDAVLDKLPEYKRLPPSEESIRNYYQAELPATFPDGSRGTYNVVALSLLSMGRVNAASATGDAIRQWHPRYLLLVGIAGGVAENGVGLGDILVSDQIVDYELQKITGNDPEIRWEVYRTDPRLFDAVKNLRGDGWLTKIGVERPDAGKPACHVGPIASGDKVVAFGKVLERYCSVWPKLIGVEMEAAGAAAAAFQTAQRPEFFMIRCVSDLADKNKGKRRVEKWRKYACHAAAAYAIAFIQSGPITSGDVDYGITSPDFNSHNTLDIGHKANDSGKSEKFINQETKLSSILKRLRNGGSCAIWGKARIGKTSILLKLMDRETQKHYIGDDADNLLVTYIDLSRDSLDNTPTNFWSEIITPLSNSIISAVGEPYYEEAIKTNFSRDSLITLFKELGKSGKRVVGLLDNFETLLSHSNFQDRSFFALLKSLTETCAYGLAVITASQWTVSEMNDWGREKYGSYLPLFNYLVEERLELMDEHVAEIFFDRAGLKIDSADRRFFRRVIGRHPWLLSTLEDFLAGHYGEKLSMQAIDDLYKKIATYLDDEWHNMDSRHRTAIILLGLLDLGLRNGEFVSSILETECLEEFGRELRKLEDEGLVKRITENDKSFTGKHCVIWGGERWTMTALVYVWWVNDVVVNDFRNVKSYKDWLNGNGYMDIVSRRLWYDLVSQVRKNTSWTAQTLARAIYTEEL